MKLKILLNNLLLEFKNDMSQGQKCVIPFMEKEDEKRCFKKYKRRSRLYQILNFLCDAILFLLAITGEPYIPIPILLFILVISNIIFMFLLIMQKHLLFQESKNYLYCFLIQEETVILYKNASIIGEYQLNEITIKPTFYYLDIYLYHITYAHVEIGDCYVSIDDSLYLKKFTLLGNKVEEDEEEQ